MIMRKLTYLLFIFISISSFAQKKINVGGGGFSYGNKKGFIYGTLLDAETKEGVIGAIVSLLESESVTVTDINGDFRLKVPLGQVVIEAQSIGFKKTTYSLNVEGGGVFRVYINPDLTELDAIVVSGERDDSNVKSTELGKSLLSIKSIKQLPMTMGEIDIIKSLTLLPGVSTNSELSTGFNVRGGGTDQNLVLLGDVPIYNPAHLFGFYTAFNAEVIEDVALYKGGVPAKFGGRASSVLQVKYRDGDYDSWKGKLAVGVVSSKLTVEGPVINNKMSVLASARRSYVNWTLKAFKNVDVRESSADFYDLNVILNFKLNDRNKLSYAMYRSTDNFNLAGDTIYSWTNFNQTINWFHSFSDKLSLKATAILSEYSNSIENDSRVEPYTFDSKISDGILNADLEYIFSDRIYLNTGVNFTRHNINPGELTPKNPDQNSRAYQKLQDESANEISYYVDATYEVNDKLTLTGGLRYNQYNYLGKHTTYQYEPYRLKNEQSIIGTTNYGKGESIQKYSGWEPRLAVRYGLNATTSLKFGYNRMFQYLNLISNTTSIAPNDVWKLSDDYLEPQVADQVSLGIYKNWNENSYETSIEGYYKETDNIIDYKNGADLFLNDHIESELIAGKGRAYGIEVYARKKSGGRLLGWVSYTYARSERQIAGAYEEETVENGDWFASNFDRKHTATAVAIYQLPKKWEFSSTLTFKSGQPLTYPTGRTDSTDPEQALFNERNNARSPVYHRLDISFTKKFIYLKSLNGVYNFSIYKFYGRKNPYSIFFQDVKGSAPQAYQLSILGVPFPSMSFTFEF
jgi:hypothetical protein